jgi:hypothetical protein
MMMMMMMMIILFFGWTLRVYHSVTPQLSVSIITFNILSVSNMRSRLEGWKKFCVAFSCLQCGDVLNEMNLMYKIGVTRACGIRPNFMKQ